MSARTTSTYSLKQQEDIIAHLFTLDYTYTQKLEVLAALEREKTEERLVELFKKYHPRLVGKDGFTGKASIRKFELIDKLAKFK